MILTTDQLRERLHAEGCAGLYEDARAVHFPELHQVSLSATMLNGRLAHQTYHCKPTPPELLPLVIAAAVGNLAALIRAGALGVIKAHSPDNVVELATKTAPCTVRELDVFSPAGLRNRMVRVLYAPDEPCSVGLRGCSDADFWQLTPEQAMWIGLALIKVASEVEVELGTEFEAQTTPPRD